MQPADYWAGRFARHGFLRDLRYDASYVSAHAVLLRSSKDSIEEVVERYERALWQQATAAGGARAERARTAAELEAVTEALYTALAESADLAAVNERLARTKEAPSAAEAERARLSQALLWANGQTDAVVARHDRELQTRDQLQERERRELAAAEERRRWLAIRLTEAERRQADLEATTRAHREQLLEQLAAARNELAALYATRTLRYAAPLRRLYGRIRFVSPPAVGPAPAPDDDPPAAVSSAAAPDLAPPALVAALVPPALSTDQIGVAPAGRVADESTRRLSDDDYQAWVARFDTPDDDYRERLKGRLAALPQPLPLFSIVMPVHDPEPAFLAEAVGSVRRQFYTRWELCVADDASRSRGAATALVRLAADDERIKLVRRDSRGHIAVATNSALELASGEWVVFLDDDDVLADDALACVALAISDHLQAKLVYSDEDKLDADGRRHLPYFKPDYDPLLLLGQNYLAHLRAVRRAVLTDLGGLEAGFDGSQDWDLNLRLAERLAVDEVVHVPRVLYHWRAHPESAASSIGAKPYAKSAARRAISGHLERTGRAGEVASLFGGSYWRVRWALPDPVPLVSVLVCTRDGAHLRRCVESIWSRTSYPRYELLIVDNGSSRHETAATLAFAVEQGARVRRDPRPFNYSALVNAATAEVGGSLLCLLDDSVEVTGHDWLEEMVGRVLQPEVGAVGANLRDVAGSVRHAGMILGSGGVAADAYPRADRLSPGYFARAALAQRLSAVTSAAMVVRREVFESVGGFDEEHLAVAFHDVDLCLRLGEAGWQVVWTPFAELCQQESAAPDDDPEGLRRRREVAYMQGRWSSRLQQDPFYNVNLSLDDAPFSLAWPPRGDPIGG